MAENIKVDLIFNDGRAREVYISASAIALVKRFAGSMPFLFDGTGFNPLAADVENIVAVIRKDHEIIHGSFSGQRKADFRLGQMDMQISVCDMLRTMTRGAPEGVVPGLILAADLVESMEVPHANA